MSELAKMNALDAARKQDSQIPSPAQFHAPQKDGNHLPNEGGNHSDRLAAARETAKTVKNIAGVAAGSPKAALSLAKDALSLGKQIDFIGDMPYAAALGAAILKDLVDFVAAETIILSIVFSALCSIFIFMMLLLVGENKNKKKVNGLLKKLGMIGAGGIADSIPGLDFLPIESVTVAFLYFTELVERKNSSK